MISQPEQRQQHAKMYFIAIVLPAHLDEQVRMYKEWMHQHYGSKVGLKSPAHITIAPPYWMDEEKEANLLSDMAGLVQTENTFTLRTANFSAFKPRTIFVAVEESSKLQHLKKKADKFFSHTDYNIKIETRAFHPHITIATRDLHKSAFAEAWPYFQHKEFLETFEVNGLSLLKHNGRTWDVIFTAPFHGDVPADAPGQH